MRDAYKKLEEKIREKSLVTSFQFNSIMSASFYREFDPVISISSNKPIK